MSRERTYSEIVRDDLTNEVAPQAQRIVFVLDGVPMEIDLNEENAAQFREAILPFARNARKTTKACLLRSLRPSRPRRNAGDAARAAVMVERLREAQSRPMPVEETPVTPPVVEAEPPDTPISSEGKKSEALSEPPGSTTTPQASNVSDFRDAVPAKWKPYAPDVADTTKDRADKANVWASVTGRPKVQLDNNLMNDWRAFYAQKLWRLAETA